MNPGRIMALNAALFLVIIGISAYVLTQEHTVPGPPPVDELVASVDERLATEETIESQRGVAAEALGQVNLFDPLVPMPTPPPPTPSPTPAPPDIMDVTKNWTFGGATSSFAAFEDTAKKESFVLRVGETRDEIYRGQPVKVRLERIDKSKFPAKAIISINEMGQKQERTFDM